MKKKSNFILSMKMAFKDVIKRRLVSKKVAKMSSNNYFNYSVTRYVVWAVAVVFILANSYNIEAQTPTPTTQISHSRSLESDIKNPLLTTKNDYELKIVADLAEAADLAVVNDAMTISELKLIQESFATQDVELAAIRVAPIFDLSSTSHEIRYHQVAPNETMQQIADKYHISSSTIRWANGLKNDNLDIGRNLKILPVDGIIIKVEPGDTLDSIANKYQTGAQRIQIINNLEVNGLQPGQEIIVPEGILPLKDRPEYVAPRPVVYHTFFNLRASGGGGRVNIVRIPNPTYSPNQKYFWGNCTWYAAARRAQLGRPIPADYTWGNATSWAGSARRAGYLVNKTPAAGAIFQSSGGWGGYGHVGIVEQVLGNGDIVVTEMNFAGFNITTKSTIKQSHVGNFNYIH